MGARKKDGSAKYEHGTYVKRRLMENAAWRALDPKAQIHHVGDPVEQEPSRRL